MLKFFNHVPNLSTDPKLWRLLGLFISLCSSTWKGTRRNSLLHLNEEKTRLCELKMSQTKNVTLKKDKYPMHNHIKML